MDDPTRSVNDGITNFGTNLLKRGVGSSSNGVVASYSVAHVLGMTLLGAKGLTAKQIKGALTTVANGSVQDFYNSFEQNMDTEGHDEVDGFGPAPPSTNIVSNSVTSVGSSTDSENGGNGGPPQKKTRTTSIKKKLIKMLSQTHMEIEDKAFHEALAFAVESTSVPHAYVLHNANKLFVKKYNALSKAYFPTVKKVYGSLPEEMKFSADVEKCRCEINRWVAEQTRDKIQDILTPGSLSPETSIVIVNAIYFKGTWMSQFDPTMTSQKKFTTINGKEVMTDMMYQNDSFPYKHDPVSKIQVLELPYVNKDLSFFVILPDSVEDFGKVHSHLNSATLNSLVDEMYEHEVSVYLPKFKIEVALDLTGVLKELGIDDLFQPNVADLTGIEPKRTLYVSGVIHQAFIEVNEEGSEAAAATAEIVRAAGAPTKRTVFKADHPFFFLIRDNRKGVILFMGQFCQPSA